MHTHSLRSMCFNEAAGFTRRKPFAARSHGAAIQRFNEAAGFTRRKQADAPPFPVAVLLASMRPPDLPGGNNRGLTRPKAGADELQ